MTELERYYVESAAMRPFDIADNPMGWPFVDAIKVEDWESFPPKNSTSSESALMPIFRYFASQCEHITEFGCREGFSTAAFAMGLSDRGGGTLISVDVIRWPVHEFFKSVGMPCQWKMTYNDIVSGWWVIDETDLLFVDDIHTYDQVKKELALHGHKAKKYLLFHDTYSQGEKSIDLKGAVGINPAIDEYTKANGWKEVMRLEYNHGLRVFEKR